MTFYVMNPVYSMEIKIKWYINLSNQICNWLDLLLFYFNKILNSFEIKLQQFMFEYPQYALEEPYFYVFTFFNWLHKLLTAYYKILEFLCIGLKNYGLLFTCSFLYVLFHLYKIRHKKK